MSIITVDQSQVLASSVLAAVSGFYTVPYAAVGLKSAPCVNAANVPVPCAAGVYGHHYGKVSFRNIANDS